MQHRQSKQQKIKSFDPNSLAAKSSNIFGLPFNEKEAETIVVPVPWEVTVSYSSGTADGPEAVFNASFQVDLHDPYLPDAWKHGIHMLPVQQEIYDMSKKLRKSARKYLNALEEGEDITADDKLSRVPEKINKASNQLNEWVKAQCKTYLDKNKSVILLGGDHSTPLGFIQALAEKHDFGILQVDAHADLREAYEGFEFSHASIMFNALKIPQVKKLVQVGIRDYSEGENEIINDSQNRVKTFFDRDIKHWQYQGKMWKETCDSIVAELPEKVYISFDIDGLDPKLCPNTGTPVAGGLEFEEVLFLFQAVAESGKQIIGCDINEIAPGKNEWDANVGARLLYRIANIIQKSKAGSS